jgi:hypothetical protein
MTERWRRLMRMARAQDEVGKALEARLWREERRMKTILDESVEFDRLAASAATTVPAAVPALLRGLAATELRLKQLETETEDLRRALLSAKCRQKVLCSKQKQLREAVERRLGQEHALETALAMAAKASRKHGVLS